MNHISHDREQLRKMNHIIKYVGITSIVFLSMMFLIPEPTTMIGIILWTAFHIAAFAFSTFSAFVIVFAYPKFADPVLAELGLS